MTGPAPCRGRIERRERGLTCGPDVQYDLHIENPRRDVDAAIHARGNEGHAPALGARRDEALRPAGTLPRADQEPRAPLLPDHAGREGARHAPAGREGVPLQAGHAPAIGLPVDARRAGRRLLRGLGPGPRDEHHQVGEAERGGAARAEAARGRGGRDAAPRGQEPEMSAAFLYRLFGRLAEAPPVLILVVRWTVLLALAWVAHAVLASGN